MDLAGYSIWLLSVELNGLNKGLQMPFSCHHGFHVMTMAAGFVLRGLSM